MDIKDLKTRADGEYVMPDAVVKNTRDAYLLQTDYAGGTSETTAIMTYAYQSYIVRPYNEQAANLLEKIAVSEMHHHEILAGLIVAVGGNPVIGARDEFWSGRNVDYSSNFKKMLVDDIAAEQRAIDGYEYTVDNVGNKSLIPILERIIADEKIHIETLKALLSAFDFGKVSKDAPARVRLCL